MLLYVASSMLTSLITPVFNLDHMYKCLLFNHRFLPVWSVTVQSVEIMFINPQNSRLIHCIEICCILYFDLHSMLFGWTNSIMQQGLVKDCCSGRSNGIYVVLCRITQKLINYLPSFDQEV